MFSFFSSIASKLTDSNNSAKHDNDDDYVYNKHAQVTSIDASSKPMFNLPVISVDFVSREIDIMSEKKATGLDDISCKLLKLAKPVIVNSLTQIMNLSLKSGVFPNAWKEAKVIPLHKGGDLSVNNFRPIAILPIVSKIIEKAVHKHLYSYLSEHNIINENQSGFRPSHSTETCLINLVNDWSNNMNAGNMTGVAFIDLRKAFDTVNHNILLSKLQNLGASVSALSWFNSYLKCRTQRVHFKDSLSNSCFVSTGVPQGSVLGPLFFIIFINSMSNVISHGKISMYADDTTLSVSGNDAHAISSKLTSDLHAVMNWLKKNKLVLNTDKTNIMLIGTGAKLKNANDFSVFIDGQELERVNKAKCLGVLIDDKLKWHNQVNSIVQKVFCKIGILRRLKPYLDVNTLNMIFKSFVQPIFDYCNITWYGRFKDDISKLDVIYKRCARIILGVNYFTSSDFMFKVLGWERLQTRNEYFKALMMYKSLNGLVPHYLATMFKYISTTHNVNTRQATAGQLALPPLSNGYDIDCFKSSFMYNGVKLWNDIDIEIRNSVNVQSFKQKYKSVYFTGLVKQ